MRNVVSARFTDDELDAIVALAAERGITHSALVRLFALAALELPDVCTPPVHSITYTPPCKGPMTVQWLNGPPQTYNTA